MLQLHSWFKHRTLKDKIIFVLSITILCCLLASFTASLVQNAMTVRSSAVDQFTLLSNIVSKQVALNLDIANRVSVPAMVSGYRQQAERTLSALSMEQSVVLSCVYLKNKSLFATYQQSTTQCPDSIPKEGYHFSDLNFHIVLPIHDINGKLQGYIYLLSNLKKIKENIFIGLGINFVFVLILLCIVYIVMVGKLQKWLANPILKLMDVTQRVLKEKDYSIRAYKHYDDEIGHLTEQFNTMLSKIEQRDRELQDYSETLEQKVEERTDELRIALDKEKHFVNKMSHEIRTPIHQVVFNLSSLIMGWTQNGERERIDMVGSSLYATQRLQRLLESVLDFEKAREGQQTYYIRECSVETLLQDVSEEFYHDTALKGIILKLIIPHTLPLLICDMTKIEQVMRNILGNAVKYSDEGTITMKAEANSYHGEEAITISICDTGVGIPEDELDVIFQPFVESSRTETKEKGTGLGLAICQEIVSAHRGEIHVKNNAESGSTFSFTLPLVQQEGDIFKRSEAISHSRCHVSSMVRAAQKKVVEMLEKATTVPSSYIPPTPSTSQKRNIVVVADDDPMNLIPLKTSIQKAGYEVADFEDGIPAWEYIREHADSIHMCFLDNMMPHMYGVEVARKMKDIYTTKHIPIVIQSGGVREKTLPEDVVWMKKPYMPGDILSALDGQYACPIDASNTVMQTINPPHTESSNKQKHIVYVDDDPINLKMMVMLIEKSGHDVKAFLHGKEALEYLYDAGDRIDAVFLDEHMPDLMGSDIAKSMLADERLQHIPIILQTGVSDGEIDADLLKQVHKLQKPYMPQDILDILDETHRPLHERSGRKKYVVYADDDSVTRKVTSRMMEKAGYHVQTFENGQEAWHYIQSHIADISVVVLDENMPGIKGSEVAVRMLSDHEMCHIPIAIQSVSETEEFTEEILNHVTRIQKPYLPDDITNTVKELVDSTT